MNELQLSLFGSAPEPELAEAIINESGVMLGNMIMREYRKGRAHVTITIARSGPAFCAGRVIAFGDESSCFAPSEKWNNYCAPHEALEDQIRESLALLSQTVDVENGKGEYDSRRRMDAQAIIDMIQCGQYTEGLI